MTKFQKNSGCAIFAFLFLWLVIWPTLETDNHFRETATENGDVAFKINLFGDSISNNSRILHKVRTGSPYWLRIMVYSSDPDLSGVKFKRVTLVSPTEEHEIKIPTNDQIQRFIVREDGRNSLRFPQNESKFDMKPSSYQIEIEYELCSLKSCKPRSFSETVIFHKKTKVYSETFAQMMGI